MADAIISVVADQLISIVKEQVESEIQLVRGVEKELQNLSAKLTKVRNVLEDADTKQFKDKNVKDWLRRLEQTSYEMEDVLEEWSYANLHHNLMESESESQSAAAAKQKVCSFFPSSCLCFKKVAERRDIAKKIQNLKSRLDEILTEEGEYKFVISQTKNEPSSASWRVQSTSLVDSTGVQGRRDDQDILVSKLTAYNEGSSYQLLSIVGVGGLGKTTLAQLVYNDSRVKECFDLRIWICVSDPFDVAAIAKGIIKDITKQRLPDAIQLDNLLKDLISHISRKKILLILDDVWNQDYEKWATLENALKCGGPGSKILVTTRDVRVARIMSGRNGHEFIHHLEVISEEDCWLLMRRSVLIGRSVENFEKFEGIGKDIAKKCRGLPLAAKTLGSLLRFKDTIEGWENVLKSEMWELEHAEVEIFPHLLLSYKELSPMLKRCFSYCAFFPKDEVIEVEKLIRYWMTLGYVDSHIGRGGDSMELIGRECFDDLAMRSLFQDFKRDKDTEEIVWCKMHDIVHDFARFLRKNDKVESSVITETSCQVCNPFSVSQVREYRSLIWGTTPPNMCDCLTSLRLLEFKWGMSGSPRGMEKLIHLRWLDISRTELSNEDLNIICKLYFLQTLMLRSCSLKEIPTRIGNLVKLRHLDLSLNYELKELPERMWRLIELRTLSLGMCSLKEISGEIGNLVHLRQLDLSYNVELMELPESICNLLQMQSLEIISCKSPFRLPKGVGELSELRVLGWEFDAGSGRNKLGLLKNLNRLNDVLYLSMEVRSVRDLEELVEDAREAELRKKIHLQILRLRFKDEISSSSPSSSSSSSPSSSSSSSSLWVDIVEALEPNHNLKYLGLEGYKGLRLPQWVSSPLNQVRKIDLDYLSELLSLPAMGNLPLLEELDISWLKSLKMVGGEWLGLGTTQGDIHSSSSLVVSFPKLNLLSFRYCRKLEEWEDITAEEEESAAVEIMPCLMRLRFESCERLKKLPHHLMRKLHPVKVLDLDIEHCDNLQNWVTLYCNSNTL